MLNYTSPIKENKNYADLVIKEIGPVMKLNLRGKKREFLSTVGKTLNIILNIFNNVFFAFIFDYIHNIKLK
mgnify:CR=1 FL=1